MRNLNEMEKLIKIFLNLIPIILMMLLILLIKNDYLLTLIYIIIIGLSFIFYYEKRDYLFFILGFIIMFIGEYFFIETNVEVFNRNTLFGIMPLWLPFLWAYIFVAIKRSINILR